MKVVAIVPWFAVFFVIPLTSITFVALAHAPVSSSLVVLGSTSPSGEVGTIEKAPISERV